MGNALEHVRDCGSEGHFKRDCPQLNQNANNNGNNNTRNYNNNNNNGGNGARRRAFTIGACDARIDNNVVTNMFYVNNLFASVLSYSGVDWSYVFLKFSRLLGTTPTPLETKHIVELAAGQPIEASHVHVGCKHDLLGQVFDIDLLPVTPGSFDVVISRDCLKHQAEILCKEKIVHILLSGGDLLSVQSHRSGAMGHSTILALVTDNQLEEKENEDIPVVRDFSDVFLEELPGLPPHRQVEFQIELTPEATPIPHAPYHLALGELQ
ncbi:uncharacterized protein LOC110942750 [Helianthus annuus]|uniref:uncharacterized protein LOC110942750 n=1 Tax=Helianthus annuus TaxID=4232 RepID=UPI000B8FAD69|nr:uncharacterized protein LOC110942750 [Helianthus annuus]